MATTPTIDEVVVADPPAAWVAAGFSVDADDVCRVGSVRIRLVGRDHGKRILGWALRGVAATDLDGLDTSISTAEPPEPSRHPNGVSHIDHIVVATPDGDRTTRALEAAGFVALRVRETDTYGRPMRQTFFRAGEVIIELIGPDEPSGDGPAVFFDRRGSRRHHGRDQGRGATRSTHRHVAPQERRDERGHRLHEP
jgi:hypothetical protein